MRVYFTDSFVFFFYLINGNIKMMITKQHKEECMYHKQHIAYLENDTDYQQLTINKLNQMLHQTG